jgi:hypothetical protein
MDVEELSQVIDSLPLPVHDQPAAAGLLKSECCPFHDGPATIDLLLAEIDSRDVALFDAALDLRSLCATGQDAEACIEQLFRVRALLAERHYLAFYRVRCWARRALRVEVRAARGAPWITREFPLDGGRLEELINSSLASLASSGEAIPGTANIRFVFALAH